MTVTVQQAASDSAPSRDDDPHAKKQVSPCESMDLNLVYKSIFTLDKGHQYRRTREPRWCDFPGDRYKHAISLKSPVD